MHKWIAVFRRKNGKITKYYLVDSDMENWYEKVEKRGYKFLRMYAL